MTRREFVAAGCGGLMTAALQADEKPAASGMGLLLYSYGLRNKAEKDRGFAEPIKFLEFAHARGASAVQMPLGPCTEAEGKAVRTACERLGMTVEGIVPPPKPAAGDRNRFEAELMGAKNCGATLVRTVLLGGRRYEVFTKAEEYAEFAKNAAETLERAEPLARKAGIKLAVENHKDFRTDELVDLLKKVSSEWIGVCVDTGNNMALLEEPVTTIDALAPFALTVHLKDMGLEEAPDGFRLVEVPLGQGMLDLKAIVARLKKANPALRFQLEMITRDPLSIPCLTEKYWATLDRVPGRDLARMLALVKQSARKQPLPRISKLTADEQLAIEDRHVRESFAFAVKEKLV